MSRRRRTYRRRGPRAAHGNLKDYNIPAPHARAVEARVSHLLPTIPERWNTQGRTLLRRI